MKVLAIIPSRYASSRFDGKPLALISGKPMIQRVYESAARAESITDIAVATDDVRIFDAVRNFGGKAMMTSPENRSGTDRVAQAAEKMGLDWDDILVNVQGDQPLIDPRAIDEVINPLKHGMENVKCEMSTLAFRIVNEEEITNPKDVKVTFDNSGFALYFSRSPIPHGRDKGPAFDVYKHLGVYAYTRRFLEKFRSLPEGRLEQIEKLEQLRAIEYGHKIRVVISEYDSPEVDLPEDILRIQGLNLTP
ncbi:MAG: 3-deoxy-D-manno-octulosonate cytidylyltransferase [Desulfobacteraceae bacterium 4572_88]|nr:MAG: 3-deoxy-D-manno-octulosonate cytidylyltransferase [Desulfobacteraceae bacterium 4572_88]